MAAVLLAALPPGLAAASVNGTPQTVNYYLSGVSASSPTDVWAVGAAYTQNGNSYAPLIESSDGTGWTTVSVPKLKASSDLAAVSADTDDDAWAVGTKNDNTADFSPLIEHWDGSSWTALKTPGLPGRGELAAVSADSPTDVWAVGNGPTDNGFIAHWDGSTWSLVRHAHAGVDGGLFKAVAAISPKDAWAVGGMVTKQRRFGTLVEHWDGTSWQRVGAPSPGGTKSKDMEGISAVSSDDIWVIGDDRVANRADNYIEHWDGSSWSLVPGVQFKNVSGLSSVSADSPTDAWVVGQVFGQPLIEHWDGTAWTRVHSPNQGGDSMLAGVVSISPTDAYDVGSFVPEGHHRATSKPLRAHWDGQRWTAQ